MWEGEGDGHLHGLEPLDVDHLRLQAELSLRPLDRREDILEPLVIFHQPFDPNEYFK
jgi:hypothetical protein